MFIDATNYLPTYKLTPRELARKMVLDVLETTGITATAGIGPNLYLAKVAMDIGAKHITPDESGVRVAELDEMGYRKQLWDHRPLTDFWRVGPGYAKKLEAQGLHTMGDIARCSLGKPTDYYNEELLYKMFGVNAELLIDHAWVYRAATLRIAQHDFSAWMITRIVSGPAPSWTSTRSSPQLDTHRRFRCYRPCRNLREAHLVL